MALVPVVVSQALEHAPLLHYHDVMGRLCPKRHWSQYSTRSLLLVTALIALACSSVALWRQEKARRWDRPELAFGEWKVKRLPPLRARYADRQDRFLLLDTEGHPAQLWDTRGGRRIALLDDHPAPIEAAAFSPGSKMLATVETWAEELKVVSYRNPPANRQFLESAVHQLRIWDTATGEPLHRFTLDLPKDEFAGASPYPETCSATWLNEGELLLQYHFGYRLVSRQRYFGRMNYWSSFHHWVSTRSAIVVVDVDSESVARESSVLPIGHDLAAYPNAKFALASVGRESPLLHRGLDDLRANRGPVAIGKVQVVDLSDCRIVHEMKPQPGFSIIRYVRSRDEQLIATVEFTSPGVLRPNALHESRVRVVRTSDGTQIQEFTLPNTVVYQIEFSPDGRYLLTVSDAPTTVLWDIASGKAKTILRGHTGTVNTAAFDPTGRFVATASDDKSVRLWQADTGRLVREFSDHQTAVQDVFFEAGGTQLVTQTFSGILRRFSVDDGTKLFESTRVPLEKMPPEQILGLYGNCVLAKPPRGNVRLWMPNVDDSSSNVLPISLLILMGTVVAVALFVSYRRGARRWREVTVAIRQSRRTDPPWVDDRPS